MDLYDITIVGGGPSGLFGAYYAGLRGMRTKIIDSLPQLGGQLSTLYPEKYIFDMPGYPKILARDLATNLVDQASQYNPAVCLEETVEDLVSDHDMVTLKTSKTVHHSRSVLLTAGVGAFNPKKLAAPGVAQLEERGVSYFVRDRAPYAGQHVVIVGGGDSALN
jgi:ferredoxin/flavodoxin---NADP+ reductase